MISCRAERERSTMRPGLGVWLIAGCLMALQSGVVSGQQRQGPIQLFPGTPSEQAPQTAPGQGIGPSGPLHPPPDVGRSERPPGGFAVEGLAAPEVDAIGLDAGFGPDLWQGSDPGLVLKLIRNLPIATQSPPLRELTRRLLITGTNLPIEPSGSLLEARVARLIAMGAIEDAALLMGQLPATDQDSALTRAAADVALLQGDDERACGLAQDVAPASPVPYWAKLTAYCRLRSGDIDGGRLAVELLREAGGPEDAAFLELADVMASGRSGGVLAGLGQPSALDIAMLRSAALPLPHAALADPSPALLAAIVATPALAPDAGLELAERAFTAGVLSAEGLAARYLETASEEAGDADLLTAISDDWGPGTRARAFRRAREEQVAAARAELLDAVWLAAAGPDRMMIARTLVEPFAGLPLDEGLVFAAPSTARALLGAERPVPAARWFVLLERAEDEGAPSEEEAAALAPLFALAGVGGRRSVPEPTAEMIATWQAASGAEPDHAARLFSLLEGVSGPVAPAFWRDLLQPPFESAAPAPSLPLWRLLERSEAAQHDGELTLIALHLLDGGRPEANREAVVRGLRALRAAGLDGQARAIAVADALMAGL
jgi:hypothetical protein